MAVPFTQIAGATSANIAEVEANTKAKRTVLRPDDYGTFGVYRVGGASGVMAAGIASGATIFSFRWSNSEKLALVRKLIFSAGCDTTSFTTGIAPFDLWRCIGFTASDSSGTALTPTGNQNKLRTSGMQTSLVTDIRISSTAALTAGTRTVVGQPFASAASGTPAVTAGARMIPPTALIDRRPGEYPLILCRDEGLLLRIGGNTFNATGTWRFSVFVEWQETSSYP